MEGQNIEMYYDLTNFAPTVSMAMGIEKGEHMSAPVTELADALIQNAGGTIEKALFLHADAVPAYVVKKNPEIFVSVRNVTQFEVPFHAVMPSITPVCFAAMFSGAYPANNGVPEYCPPVITDELVQPSISCGTLIDILVQAGKKVAVITCADGCIAAMLHSRGADIYTFSGNYDKMVYENACSVLQENRYDVIFIYQLAFDHIMHAFGPESQQALDALNVITNRFETLAEMAQEVWKGHRIMTVFNSDHGSHLQPDGTGNHGKDIPEDMDITWFFGSHCCK